MESICVRVVDHNDDPVEGKLVTIFLHHWVLPATYVEDYTNEEGRAYFQFDDCVSVDVHVGGSCQLEEIDDEGEVTVCI